MIIGNVTATPDDGKGWFVGPWNSPVPVAVGWADRGVDLPHHHDEMCEVYLVARGRSVALVVGKELSLTAGDMLVVEPGEDHTFLSSSEDYLHFVVQAPFVKGDKVELTGGQTAS
jgi:mannose-6-phosphate isomerase-like protein (cupin superfamily)